MVARNSLGDWKGSGGSCWGGRRIIVFLPFSVFRFLVPCAPFPTPKFTCKIWDLYAHYCMEERSGYALHASSVPWQRGGVHAGRPRLRRGGSGPRPRVCRCQPRWSTIVCTTWIRRSDNPRVRGGRRQKHGAATEVVIQPGVVKYRESGRP